MEKVTVIKLGCVSCGAALTIGQEITQLACGHCGTSQTVQRDGGAVHLKEVAETLSRVQAGTDKTAAELAISRLTNDLNGLYANLREYENQRSQHRAQRYQFWNEVMEKRRKMRIAAAVAGGVVAFIILTMIVNAIRGLESGTRMDGTVSSGLGLLLLPALGFGALAGREILIRLMPDYKPRELRDSRDQELSAIDAVTERERANRNTEAERIQAQIEKNVIIANS